MANPDMSLTTMLNENSTILLLDSNYNISSDEPINIDEISKILSHTPTSTMLCSQTDSFLPNTASSSLTDDPIKSNENTTLEYLLRKWNLFEELYDFLKGKGITYEGLKYIKERHLDELFGGENLNCKIILEHQLAIWQNENGINNLNPRSDFERLPVTSPVESWINNMDSPSTSTTSLNDINVLDIIKNTEQGRALFKRYEERGFLSPQDRTELVHKIVQYYIENDISLSVSKCRNLGENIVKLFPSEQMATYFIGRGKYPPKGKIWDRYQGRRRALRKLKTISKPLKTKNLETIISEDNEDMSESELQEISQILKHLRKWDEVIFNWKKTVKYRRKLNSNLSLQEILKNWPLYKYSQAPDLIEIDYQYIHPNKVFSFLRWEQFCQIALPLFEERIKDAASKIMLQDLKEKKDDLNSDNKNILLLQLLHAVLVPTSRILCGKRVKFTIRDSQKAFTVLVPQSSEISSAIVEKRQECLKSKTTLQPFIIAVGKQYEYEHFYVDFDGEKFKTKTYLEAIQYCFKLIFVFNLKYPSECIAVWVFIENFFFLIEETLEKFPVVETFISDLKQRMPKDLLSIF